MSRTRHTLRSSEWYGGWARMFHLDRRELRRFTARRRARDDARVEQREARASSPPRMWYDEDE